MTKLEELVLKNTELKKTIGNKTAEARKELKENTAAIEELKAKKEQTFTDLNLKQYQATDEKIKQLETKNEMLKEFIKKAKSEPVITKDQLKEYTKEILDEQNRIFNEVAEKLEPVFEELEEAKTTLQDIWILENLKKEYGSLAKTIHAIPNSIGTGSDIGKLQYAVNHMLESQYNQERTKTTYRKEKSWVR